MPIHGRIKFGMYEQYEKAKDKLSKCVTCGLWFNLEKGCTVCRANQQSTQK